MDKYNFFQQTPKKEDSEKDRLGSSNPPVNSLVPLSAPSFDSTQQSSLPFGNSTNIFGQKPSFGNNQSFGGSNVPFGSSNTSFSSPSTNNPNPIGGNATFGNTFGTGTTPFGGTSNITSTFGKPSAPTTQFGSMPGTQFGSGSASQFGSTPAPQFGTTSNMQLGNTSTTPFGASSGTRFNTTPNTGSFGSSWNAQPSLSSGWNMTNKGSRVVPYSTTRIREDTNLYADLVDITGMKEYVNKPIDEVRKEDYEMSFSQPKPTSGFSSTTSGNAGFSSSFSGNTPNSGLFGATTAPAPTSSGFGSTNVPSSGLFGSSLSKPFASTGTFQSSTMQPGQFGTQPGISTTQPNLFGNQPNPSNMQSGVFGAQPISSATSTGFPTATPSIFSASQQSTMPFSGTSNIFGNAPAQPSATTNLFGSKPGTDSSIITPPSLSPFGTPANKASTGPLGAISTTPMTQPQSTGTGSSIFGSQPSTNFLGTQPPTSLFNTQPPSNLFTTQPTANLFNTQQQSVFGTPSFTSPSASIQPVSIPTKVDMSDPYLLKNIQFEKFEQQKPSLKVSLPTPLFKTNKDKPVVELKIRAPKPIQRNAIYTIPELKDVDATQTISNLVIGFEGKGRIEFLEPVSVKSLEDIEKRISFRDENVETTDTIGSGLNKRARVYVEGLFPICRTTNEIIKGKAEAFPQKGIQERFIYQLKNDSTKKFIDYDVDNGIYVYEVNHF
ncbi:uncharacterized protein VICG_00697 [Vittaforma corneae ATCC 50505]|uniref:Peptidase S59 domain-containing protein n=1 Tax=Vittaforma corneae (strain ATCC 50505) TaxID=993615 RepID=L2GPQ6_VITCO|nr:uncharacterized protein VICG_00697 [Vittaforma corneae ATCC 50505]ELA42297.1 hypothetical protein VICG_00697 [Vittaforma corneae ATCC 50505]